MRSLLVFVLTATQAWAGTYAHQGRLLDAAGSGVQGTTSLVVRVHDSSSEGSVVWEKTFANVAVDDGYYSLSLGGLDNTTRQLDEALAGDRWLSIDAGTGAMSRTPVHDVPHAETADSVPVIDSTAPCTRAGQMGFDTTVAVGAICDGSAWRVLSTTPSSGSQRRLLVSDHVRSNSSIIGTTGDYVYTSLDGKAGPFTINTRGGPVRIYLKAMTYVYGHNGNASVDYASLLIHPVIEGVRQDYCDYVHDNGFGVHGDMHAPVVCDVIYDLPAGQYTVGFEHRSRGYQSILNSGSRSAILIEELPAAEDYEGTHIAPSLP